MATLHDTALGSDDSSGTTLATSDALAVTAGDLVVLTWKREGASGSTASGDTGAATPAFSTAQATLEHANGDLAGGTMYWIATATTTINPRLVLSAARPFRKIKAFSFTPAGGKTFEIDGAGAQAQGSGDTLSSGAGSYTADGCAVAGFALYASDTMTVGAGWAAEPAEFTGSDALKAEYQLLSGSGSVTGNATLAGTPDWVASLAIFKEVAAAGGTVTAWLRA
jgi:hypothetical protein